MNYNHFNLAIYCTAGFLNKINIEDLKKDISFFKKHLKISKVYLETHRGHDDVPKNKMLEIKNIFENESIKTSGGITATIDYDNIDPYKDLRIFHTFCYTNEKLLTRLQEIVEYTASLFDEIIFDDFYFTNCSCPSCIEQKGNLSWEEFRLNLMTKVSQEYIVKPAKKINPSVNMIIKYPNWNESYQETGYNPETQINIFDEVYTGTETRDAKYTQQHLSRYLSYSLMRWFENLAPNRNGGGWFDSFDCIYNLGYYLEQAYLTVFSKAKELTLFDFNSLRNSVFVPPLGHELERLDNLLGYLGNPQGVYVYQPFHSYGEDHLYDYLGMVGIPFEPLHYFPNTKNTIFITANCSKDKNIIDKIKNHLLNGGNIIMTSGFVKKMEGFGVEDLTSLRYTDKKVVANTFAIQAEGCAFERYEYSKEKIIIPVLEYRNNATWPLIVSVSGENNFPILTEDTYGKGRIYTLVIPDNYSDLYYYPKEVLTYIRQIFMSDFDFYIDGEEKLGIFLYDNNTFILESFLPYRSVVTVHIKDKNKSLIDAINGIEYTENLLNNEKIYRIKIEPTTFKVFKIN
ncbi:permease [Caldicellulosiruptoraceae bacterium PP1]